MPDPTLDTIVGQKKVISPKTIAETLARTEQQVKETTETINATAREINFAAIETYRKVLEEFLAQESDEKKWQIQEIKRICEQQDKSFQQILSILNEVHGYLQKVGGNAELEREVLVKLNQKLGV